MSLDAELVREAIKRNDATGVRELLRDTTEADRRACARALRPLLGGPDFSQLGRIPFPGPETLGFEGVAGQVSAILALMTGDRQGEGYTAADRVRVEWKAICNSAAFLAASLGLAGGAAAAHIAADRCDSWRQPADPEFDTIAGVLADRRPPWLADLVDRKLRAPFRGLCSWTLARKLVGLGVIERPDVPEYTTRMVSVLHQYVPDQGGAPTFTHPLDGLLADPGLLEDEVWRLFTVPGAAAGLEERWHRGTCWQDALAVLSEQGRLDRGRLLDACLDAFGRGFAPNQIDWYVSFHDRMSPSVDEMAERAGRYIRLLTVEATPAVSLGQKACGRLLAAGRLSAEDFLAASGPALLSPRKAVATAQLKLIGTVAATQPSVRDLALAAAARAFGHQRLDIQEAALGLIAGHGLPEGPQRLVIAELAGSLAPALNHQATALGLPGRSPAAERHVSDASRSRVEPSAGDRLPPPLEDPAELIQLLTRLMEDASDALAVERAMAGAVRLCGLPVAERARLARPLFKRAESRLREDYDGPFGGREIACDIAGLTMAWGSGWSPDIEGARRVWGSEGRRAVLRSGQARTMAGILTARIWEASALVAAGRPAELLAEPEFERGAVGPDRLLGRLTSWTTDAPPRHDLEIALLRLGPEVDDSFWSAWDGLHPSSQPAARRVHRQGLAPLDFEPWLRLQGDHHRTTSSDPVVVARITEPPGHDGGSRCWALLTALSHPLRDFYEEYGAIWSVPATPRYRAVVAGWPLLCPWQPELAAAHLLRPLSQSLRSGSTWAGIGAAAVGGLSHPGHTLGQIGHLALAAGLASAEPYVRIAAAEVWAKACLDGRLDPVLAASAIVTGVTGKAFKLNRIADGLQYASHDPVAGRRIAQTVLAAADGLVPAKPANLHLLFELAARIGVAAGTEPPAAITRIAAGKGSSQLAAAARRLARGGP